jgi:hypothetical protein
VIVIDEYLAVRVVGGAWPEGLPDDEDLGLPASRHWRLLQRMHAPGDGQLSAILAQLSHAGRDGIRHPHPEVLGVLDPRLLPDDAAALAALLHNRLVLPRRSHRVAAVLRLRRAPGGDEWPVLDPGLRHLYTHKPRTTVERAGHPRRALPLPRL